MNWSCDKNTEDDGEIFYIGGLSGDVYRNGSLIIEQDLRTVFDLFGSLKLELNLTTPELKLRMFFPGP